MNPFDLRGPEFLVVYAALTLIILFVLSQFRRAREATPAVTLPPISDPYAIAYLRGGQKAMLEVAAFSLVERGLLSVEDGNLVTSGRHEAKLATNPLDKVEHIGGAMKRTCCTNRAETNCGNDCSALLLLYAHGAPSLRA